MTKSHVRAAEGSLVEEIVIKTGIQWRQKGLFVLYSGHFAKLCVPQTELVEHIYNPTLLAEKSNQQQHAS